MNPDKLYYYDAQVDANVYFDSGKVKEGLESLHNHIDKGYRPIDMHMHIIIFASLRKRLTVHKRSVIRDKEVELANTTLLDLSRLVNQPSSLLSCIPTSERGSSEKCADYDVRDYAVYKNANRMIKGAKGGIWDLVIEPRGMEEQAQKQKNSLDDDDDDEDDDDVHDDILAVARRGSKRKSTGHIAPKKEKMPKRESSPGKIARRQRVPSSSPLTEIEDDDEEDEVVNKNAWLLLDWIIDLWIRAKGDAADPYNDAFLRQLPSHGDAAGPRWSIARPMTVVRSAIKHIGPGSFCDPFEVGSKMLSLLYSYTKMEPPAIDPEALFHAAATELVDIDISEGKDRLERYLEMVRSATATDFYNNVLARAIDLVTNSDRPANTAVTLSTTLEWLTAARLPEKRRKGVPLAYHQEKFACMKAYLLVSLFNSATTLQLQEWPSDRRQASIDKIFDGSQMDKSSDGLRQLKQSAECLIEDYKALVMAVHHGL